MDPEKKARLEAAGFHVTNDPRDLLEPLEVINELRARVAELEAAMGNLLLAAEHVSVFVNSRERIQSTTGKTWYEDQLAIARSVLNP